VLDKGLSGSPLLEDNINSIWSMPSIPKLSSTFISTEKRASGKYKSCSSFSIKEISDVAVSFLIAVMFSAFFNAKAVCSSICTLDRKSTRLNSSHVSISYAVFCLKKKTVKKKNQMLAELLRRE